MLEFAVMHYVEAVVYFLIVYYLGQYRAMQKLERARKLNSPVWQKIMREEAMEVARLAQELDQATAENKSAVAQSQLS